MNTDKTDAKVKPSELSAEAERLIREGKMPSFEEVLAIVADMRKRYREKLLEVRHGAKETLKRTRSP